MTQNINEVFDTKFEQNPYEIEKVKETTSSQIYNLKTFEQEFYQVRFLNAKGVGPKAQTVLIGQTTATAKTFKPLVKKITQPLALIGALKELLNYHAYLSVLTKNRQGFAVVLQKNSTTQDIAGVAKIMRKALMMKFDVSLPVVTPTAAQLGIGLKEGSFDVLLVSKKMFNAKMVFSGVVVSGGDAVAAPTVYDQAKDLYDEPPTAVKSVDHKHDNTKKAAKQWFFSNKRRVVMPGAAKLNDTFNIGFIEDGYVHNYYGATIAALTPGDVLENPDTIKLDSDIDADQFFSWMKKEWAEPFELACGALSIKPNTGSFKNPIVVKGNFDTGNSGGTTLQFTALKEWFISKCCFLVTHDGVKYTLPQIYKFYGLSDTSGTKNPKATETPSNMFAQPATTQVAPPVATPAAPAKPKLDVTKLTKPKKGVANGLQHTTYKPLVQETVEWLAANPPASLKSTKAVVAWPAYKNPLTELAGHKFEVDGFDITFTPDAPEKLFKQLSNFEKYANGAQVTALSDQIDSLMYASQTSNMKQLAALQAEHFPSSTAISAYTGSAYDDINNALRGQVSDAGSRSKVASCDNYFKKHGKPLPANVVVYRGQSILLSEIAGLVEGNEYILHSFVSTSLNLSTANGFMKSYVKISGMKMASSGGAELKITKASDLASLGDMSRKIRCMLVISGLENTLSVAPGEWGNHEGECEIILNRGTRVRIDTSIPVKVFKSSESDENQNTAALIYCKIVGDGTIDYEVNEMTDIEESVNSKAQQQKSFADKVKGDKKRKAVEAELLLVDASKKKATRPEEPGDARWSDDAF